MVAYLAKYLGFFIGPGAGNKEWEDAFSKYFERCTYIANLGLPFFSRVILYRTLAVSTLAFPAQLRLPPRTTKKQQLKGISIIFHGPGKPGPIDFFSNLTSSNMFPVDLPDLLHLSLAVRAR
eukprot:6326358-Karenia_brevis.AAC.1